jgi:16S rRNA (guanine966-N2)-methyltransferase
MKLRIVAGALGRRVITVDKRAQGFRPTQERIRQAVAETLKPRIPGARAADVCAGSGAMGIEIMSRGASSVDFVEKDRVRATCIERQCAAFGIQAQCRILPRDARTFIDKREGPYDIIFYDPPYGDPVLAALVPSMAGQLAPGGVLVYERDKSDASQGETLSLTQYRVEVRSYGDTAVEFISRID